MPFEIGDFVGHRYSYQPKVVVRVLNESYVLTLNGEGKLEECYTPYLIRLCTPFDDVAKDRVEKMNEILDYLKGEE